MGRWGGACRTGGWNVPYREVVLSRAHRAFNSPWTEWFASKARSTAPTSSNRAATCVNGHPWRPTEHRSSTAPSAIRSPLLSSIAPGQVRRNAGPVGSPVWLRWVKGRCPIVSGPRSKSNPSGFGLIPRPTSRRPHHPARRQATVSGFRPAAEHPQGARIGARPATGRGDPLHTPEVDGPCRPQGSFQ